MAIARGFAFAVFSILFIHGLAREGSDASFDGLAEHAKDEMQPESLYSVHSYGGARVTHQTYLDVLKQKLMDALLGFGLVLLAFPVLYFNEKRQVHMEKIFAYGESIVKDGVKSAPVDPANEHCLVNVQGDTATQEELVDRDSGIRVTNCAKLRSVAEMYQWIEKNTGSEERDTPGGGKETITTYSYELDWSAVYHDSSCYNEPAGHENPPFYVNSSDSVAKDVQFGDYALTSDLIEQMRNFTPVTGEPSLTMGGRGFELEGDRYSTCPNSTPELGDMRYTICKVECGAATVLSIQSGNSFAALTYDMIPSSCCSLFGGPSRGDKVAALEEPLLGEKSEPKITGVCSCIGALIEMKEELNELATDLLPSGEMFARARATQGMIRMLLRLLGFVMLYSGFYCQFSFFPAVFRIIPFLGTWIEWLGQWLAVIGAIFMAVFHYCMILAAAWIVLRPIKGILLLCFGAAMIAVPSILAQHAANQAS